jgi:hypothetical protein
LNGARRKTDPGLKPRPQERRAAWRHVLAAGVSYQVAFNRLDVASDAFVVLLDIPHPKLDIPPG